MKYIMLQNKQTGQKVPVIFPNFLIHSLMAAALTNHPLYSDRLEVISAGECTISCTSVSGGSETLGLSFGDGDSQVIDMMDYLHGL